MAKKGVYRPSCEELSALLGSGKAMTEIGAMYGVTRQAVRLWAKRYGLYKAAQYTKVQTAFLGVRMSERQAGKLRLAAKRARKSQSAFVREWIDTLG